MNNKQVNLKNRQFSNYEVQIANKYEKNVQYPWPSNKGKLKQYRESISPQSKQPSL